MAPNILNASALVFIVPCIKAWVINHTYAFRYILLWMNITSQIYHATHHPVMRTIDIISAHSTVVYHIAYSMYCSTLTWRVYFMYASAAYAALIYWIFRKSRTSDTWHASMHFITCIGSYLLISEPLCLSEGTK